VPFDPLDLYGLKHALERINEVGDLVRETVDPHFLMRARKALMPLPVIDRPAAVENPLPPSRGHGRSPTSRASAWR
jgi:hypothetical protein